MTVSAPLPTASLLGMLSDLPAAALLAGDQVSEAYAHDLTGGRSCRPEVVLRPASTQEVSRMLAACHALGQPVVVQGGRTGLANGATPRAGEVALCLDRMTALGDVDPVAATVTAEAGVTLARVQEAASEAGLSFGVDIGSRGTATMGGMASTNAGGLNVIRQGMFRAHVVSLEAVLADGRIMGGLRPLPKDNTGYDLKQLFIGSEGTLGVVTRLCLGLRPAVGKRVTAFASVPGLAQARALLARMRRDAGGGLLAFEIIDAALFTRILARGGRSPVTPGGMQVLVEVETASADPVEQGLMAAIAAGEVTDATLAHSEAQRADFWSLREGCAEAVWSMEAPQGYDIGVPTHRAEGFLSACAAGLAKAAPGAEIAVFGHLGDGNLHYIVNHPDGAAVSDVVMAETARVGGAVSAEHGLGQDKAKYLASVRSAEEVAMMRGLKGLFDPRGILNPGRVLPEEGCA